MNRIQSLSLVLVLALALSTVAPAAAPALANGNWRYFGETGCWVGAEFLTFFDKRGGVDIFGFPIDNATIEDGLTVQYFQRARMELHPEASAAYRVQLGLLGQLLLGRIDPPVTHDRLPAVGDRNHEYFPDTGQVVSYAFLEYFRARGGVDVFGYPISAQAVENGVTVQYFQRARLEWRPGNPEAYRVQPGLVGSEYYMRRYGQPPSPTPSPSGTPTMVPPPATATATATAARAPVTATAGSVPAQASPVTTAAPPASPSPASTTADAGGFTISHLIMFLVTFAVVILVGLALLWRRGSLQDWLARRGSSQGGSQDSGPWSPGA